MGQHKRCISSEENTGLLFAKWPWRNFPQASAQISWDLWGFSWYIQYWEPVSVTGITEVLLCPSKNEWNHHSTMFSFALDMTVGRMSCAKHYLPLNPDLQTLLDCSAQSQKCFQSCPHDCALWGTGNAHKGGCPPLCAMMNCLLRELQNNGQQLRFGIFP